MLVSHEINDGINVPTLLSEKNLSLRWRRTKIIATIGPASDSTQNINKLIKSGVNVFRLNLSHGDHNYHRKIFNRIRRCAKNIDIIVAILMDLCGPKIRVGRFSDNSINLKKNSKVIISCSGGIGDEGFIVSQYKKLYKDVRQGERILLDDGNMECRVESIDGTKISCKVIYGGTLKNNKGMNLPDSNVSASSFTEKDKKDVQLAMSLDADFVALSFVRTANDIRCLKKYMARVNKVLPIIAKIEKPQAVENLDEIIDAAYGIMIARGDLGIELPAEKVPLIQKNIINKARIKHRPVIVATQMMESMIDSPRPTRAEVGDVANAAMSSADAVMLSAETAVGKYPIKTVEMMGKILREIEKQQWSEEHFGHILDKRKNKPSSRRAIAHAANTLTKELMLRGILIPTRSGHTAAVLSACRPLAPLLGISTNKEICRKLALHWGVIPFFTQKEKMRDWNILSQEISHRCKLAKMGDKVLLVSGFNEDETLNEPVLKIIKIKN